jgi:VWFA-related protein
VLRIVLLMTALGVSLLEAQTESEPQRLIRLTVSAVNAKGEAVTDLAAGDIQLREDGKQRSIAFFRFAGSNRPTASLAEGEIGKHPAAAPTVILLDRWNDRLSTTASAGDDIITALLHLESVDRVYIYLLTNQAKLIPVHPLPATEGDLRSAEPSAAQLVSQLNDALRKYNGFRNIDVQDPALRVNATIQALNALGQQMALIAGRKNLIWITHGFPLVAILVNRERVDYTPVIRNVSAAAARTGMSIYAVDQSAEGAGANLASMGRLTLEAFTGLTGGRWYPSGNAGRSLSGAMTDSVASYRLAYYAADRENDHKEHKIRIDSSRKGIRCLTREGHFDDISEPDPSIVQESVLGSARRSPFDATEIGLGVRASRNSSNQAMHFEIRVEPADVMAERGPDGYRRHLALVFAYYSEGFLKQATAPVNLDFKVTEEQLKDASKGGINISQDVPVAGNVDKIRVIVFDRVLYGLGSVTMPVQP